MRSVKELVDQRVSPSWEVAVPVQLPSGRVIAIYRPDWTAHQRRRAAGVGPVTSTATLSALWEFPAGLPIPIAGMDSASGELVAGGLLVDDGGGRVRREFAPCGAVTALFVVAARGVDALRRASMLSPIYERWAVATGRITADDEGRLRDAAESCHVGLLIADRPTAVCAAPAPVRGRPHVFRWWMTELAYAAWLLDAAQPSAQAFSCALDVGPTRPSMS